MPIVPLKLVPTVNAEYTPTLNESGISSCNLIRFKSKLPQKLGGWEKFYPFAVSGVPRCLHAWQDLNSNRRLAVGATQQLAVITAGILTDITPQTLTSDFAPDFTTTLGSPLVEIIDANINDVTTYDAVFFDTPISVGGLILHGTYQIAVITSSTSYQINVGSNATAAVSNGGAVPVFDTTSGSAIVTVTFADHGLSAGDQFTFPIPTTAGGLTIDGTYSVVSAPTSSTFTIAANAAASSTATVSMNSGDAQLLYYIAIGPQAAGSGYGLGGYGEGGYGLGITPDGQTGTPITATDWTEDNWGEILVACPKGGGIYQWRPTSGFQNAQLIATAPIFNEGIFISMPQQILVAYGSTTGAPAVAGTGTESEQQDPLIVRWSAQLDFTDWIPTAINQAGSFRIPTGSRIVGALQGPQQGLIWTDLDLWAMQYLGPPLVFSFNKISAGCGLIGQHAAAVMRGSVYWMSPNNFFMFGGGGVQQIPCTVWDAVFQNLNTANQSKCVAAANSAFDEIWWFYPSAASSGECDSYVKFNIEEKSWDYGSLPRSAWIDQSVLGEPIAATPSGVIYQHETSPDADGLPLNAWFETGWFVITEGQNFSFVDWFFPDMKWALFNGAGSANVLVTIYATDYPNGTVRTFGPYTMTSASTYINTRLRGRQIKLRFESNDIGSFWRLGNMRFRMAGDGRR